jgi:DNA (cytosine-5)-methyltransferase 3A
MNVLSLFDGISVARVALDLAHIEVKNYYASEIEKNAISISKKNYPSIVRFGSVIDLCANMIPEPIDLLIGGSPCQDLSIAKKARKGLEGDRSGLFWEYVRIMNEVKPKYFILENVASMPQKDKDIISGVMGCEPILFNASLVSAQCRKRLFWTNIPFELPIDKGIILKDILQPPAEIDEKMVNKDKKAYTLTTPFSERKQLTMVKVGTMGKTYSQGNSVYSTEGKSCTLSARGGGIGSETGLYKVARVVGRRLNSEGKRDDYNKDISIEQQVEIRSDDKSGTLTTVQKDNMVVNSDYSIRKLTPIECERLQSLPDNYTEGIATTNRYKCLGNAFNAEVIAHILKGI